MLPQTTPLHEDIDPQESSSVYKIIRTEKSFQLIYPYKKNVSLSRKQWEIINSDAKRKIVCAGTGFGKDHIGILDTVSRALQLYGERMRKPQRRAGPMVTVAICAPSEPNYLETWDKLVEMVPQIPGTARDGKPNYICRDGKKKSITLFGKRGIRFLMITLWDANNVRGQGWDLCLITEAAYMKYSDFDAVVLKRVNRAGYFGWLMLISTPNAEENDGWFDDACEEAMNQRGDRFGDWAYFHGTSYDNPLLTLDEDHGAEQKERFDKEAKGNFYRFLRERMARLHVIVPSDAPADCPVTHELLNCAFTKDKIAINQAPLVVFDLAYGGSDRVVRGVWNKAECALARIDIWTCAELKMDPKNPHASITKLFEETAAKFPGCTIVYDATGPNGSIVNVHVKGYINLKPITRNNTVKNKNVGDFLERLANISDKGISRGIKLPSPESPHLDKKQRENMRWFLRETIHYRKIEKYVNGKLTIVWTKGEGHGDDTVDMATIACGELPPMRPISQPNTKQLSRFLRS